MGYCGLRWIASCAYEMGVSNTFGLHGLRYCCIPNVCTVCARCVHEIGCVLLLASACNAASKSREPSINALTRSLREGAKSRGWLYTNAEERIYTLISYRDLLNRGHEEYYLVEPVVGASRISNEEGQAKFTAWRINKLRQRISDLSADIVFGELSTTLARRE
jgi:hypothetical protein